MILSHIDRQVHLVEIDALGGQTGDRTQLDVSAIHIASSCQLLPGVIVLSDLSRFIPYVVGPLGFMPSARLIHHRHAEHTISMFLLA